TLITLTLVASTGSLQGCTAAVRVSSGVATFTGCQVSEEGTADHLHASNGGTFTADSVNFNVADLAVSTIGGFSLSAVEGAASASQTVATFTDPGTSAGEILTDYSASIDWGDSSSSAGTISLSAGVFTVKGSHTYAEEGTKTIDRKRVE